MSEFSNVPVGRNLVHDPRPVSASFFGTDYPGTVFPTFTTERSFSGAGSVRLTLPAGQSAYWTASVINDPDFTSLPTGGSYYGSMRVSGPVPTGIILHPYMVMDNDVWLVGDQVPVVASSDQFSVHTWQMIMPVGRNPKYSWVYIINSTISTHTLYVGGFDLRKDQAVDSFIHGDAGDDYFWEGAANNSPSQRRAFVPAPIFGHGGQVTHSIAVEVVTRSNVLIRDITENFLDGSVTYDLDADQWKGTCNLTLNEPGLVEPLADEYVRVTLRVDYADGTTEEAPIGMFMMDPPKERWSSGFDTWAYTGRDLLAFLASFSFRGEVIPPDPADGSEGESTVFIARMIEAGKPYREALIDILTNTDPKRGVGLSASQISFPASLDAVSEDNLGWEGGTDALTMITDILQAAGWQKPWVTPYIVITSAPAGVDPATVTPSITLATGENSRVRWPFEIDPDATAVGNRVRVVSARNANSRTKKKKGQKNVAVEVWATNEDPSHPISFNRLGRWIDIPDIKVPLVSDEAEAQQLATQALIDAGQLPIRARLTTQAMVRGLNEVYELNLVDAYGDPIASGQGRYWCRGWSIQLGQPWEMVHNLSRVIAFGQASFLKVQGT